LVFLAWAGCAPRQDSRAAVPNSYSWIYSGGLGSEEYDQIAASLPYKSIELKRMGCFGPCPIYTVTFFRSGRAVYVGKDHVSRIGRFSGVIHLPDYGRLCLLIDQFGLERMKPRYSAGWIDDATTVLRVTPSRSSSAISVSDYGAQGPVELWVLQEIVDGITAKIEWVKARPDGESEDQGSRTQPAR